MPNPEDREGLGPLPPWVTQMDDFLKEISLGKFRVMLVKDNVRDSRIVKELDKLPNASKAASAKKQSAKKTTARRARVKVDRTRR